MGALEGKDSHIFELPTCFVYRRQTITLWWVNKVTKWRSLYSLSLPSPHPSQFKLGKGVGGLRATKQTHTHTAGTILNLLFGSRVKVRNIISVHRDSISFFLQGQTTYKTHTDSSSMLIYCSNSKWISFSQCQPNRGPSCPMDRCSIPISEHFPTQKWDLSSLLTQC